MSNACWDGNIFYHLSCREGCKYVFDLSVCDLCVQKYEVAVGPLPLWN